MWKLAAAAALAVGCAAGAEPTTTVSPSTSTAPAPSSTAPASTSSSAPHLEVCPPAPYEIGFLPFDDAGFDPSEQEPDVWTSVGGAHTTFYGPGDGTAAVALIRGALPAVDWPGAKGVVQVDGVDAAVGEHADGTWAAGWHVPPRARCDLYTMVFYPPWDPKDVEAVLAGMVRAAG